MNIPDPVFDMASESNAWQCPTALDPSPEDFLLNPTIVSQVEGDRNSNSVHHYAFFTTGQGASNNSCAWIGTTCMKGSSKNNILLIS